MLALVDNYDSFTYNLVQYFGDLGAELRVFRNDEIDIKGLAALGPKGIVISAGPCTPNEAGISMEVSKQLAEDFPIFGVCLGMQSMVQAYGGKIVRAKRLMHGKLTKVYYRQQDGTDNSLDENLGENLDENLSGLRGLFTGMSNPFIATRYNSLEAELATLPDCFEIIAWSYAKDEPPALNNLGQETSLSYNNEAIREGADDIEIMAVSHKTLPLSGVQFHPESILSDNGKQILNNFLTKYKI